MDLFFNPKSVAVVGISESPDNMARTIAKNLHEFSYEGIIYLVGSKGGTAFGRRIYKSLADIPDKVDLAVILVPSRFIPGILEECSQKGIQHVIIESAGFSEYGPEGKVIEEQVVEVARKNGIRFIGPNGIGVMNLKNGLVVPFAGIKDVFVRGKVSILSQSGGVGLSYLNMLASENIGIAKFASVGNKLDVDENDLLEYLIEDPDTDIVCMYLESISSGRRLMQIARRTSKPILLHKSNIGALAREIAHSHTASLSGDDAVVSAALKQAGIARFDDSNTLFNYLKILPLPCIRGNRLAIVSRSGGHAVMAADACEKTGFTLTPFPEPFLREIEKHFRASVIKLTNPLDLGDLFDFDVYTRIIEETLKLADVDAVVFLHTYMSALEGEASRALLHRCEELSRLYVKPVVTCVATDGEEMTLLRKTLKNPAYVDPEDAIASLALMRDFKHEARPEPKLPEGPLDMRAIRSILDACRSGGRSPLLDESLRILRAAGLRVPEFTVIAGADEAAGVAGTLKGPLAMKIIASEASHKTDVGGVHLNLSGADALRSAYEDMARTAGSAGIRGPVRAVVQPMVAGARELIVGSRWDRTFGHVVLVGIGGIFVEVFHDVAMRVVPFEKEEAMEMIRSLKGHPIIAGVRGQAPRDIGAVRDAILSVARLVSAYPEIEELDINPLMTLPDRQGALAVDARIVLGPGGER